MQISDKKPKLSSSRRKTSFAHDPFRGSNFMGLPQNGSFHLISFANAYVKTRKTMRSFIYGRLWPTSSLVRVCPTDLQWPTIPCFTCPQTLSHRQELVYIFWWHTYRTMDFCGFRCVTSDVTLTPSYKLMKFFALISAVLLRSLDLGYQVTSLNPTSRFWAMIKMPK